MRRLWSWRSSAVWLIAGNLVVAVAVLTTTYHTLRHGHQGAEDAARRTAENLAVSLSIKLESQVRLIDNALATVATEFARHDDPTRAEQAAIRLAIEQHRLVPNVLALGFTGGDGQLVSVSQEPSPPSAQAPRLNVSDREYFVQARSSPGMVISEPILDRLTGQWIIVFARRLHTASGEFAGVIGASIASPRLIEQLGKLDLGATGVITIRNQALTLLALYKAAAPSSQIGVGTTQNAPQLGRQLSQNLARGSYHGVTPIDQVERVSAFHRVSSYPLIVTAGLSARDYLAGWRADVLRHTAVAALILAMTIGISWSLFRGHQREREARLAATELAREQSLMVENDLIGMMRVKNRVTTWHNKAAAMILGYPPGTLVGTPSRDLYLDDETFEYVGRVGYKTLQVKGKFRTQVRMQRRSGDPIWIDLSGTMVAPDESLWMIVDIEDIKREEARAVDLALRDALTGLPNRRLFDERFPDLIAHARRTGSGIVVCYFDLDLFKPINDRYGHEAGDAVLRAVGRALQSRTRSFDIAARVGGDEFALILSEFDRADDAVPVLERILWTLRQPIPLDTEREVRIDVSVGVVWDDGSTDPHTLVMRADEAMYAAKRAGGGINVFTPQPAVA